MNIDYTKHEDGTEQFDIDPVISGSDNYRTPGVLRLYKRKRPRGRTFSISNIASGFFYVHRDALIGDVVEDMNTHETLLAVGMVGDEGEALGVITRRELFNLLGKSFGEDAAKDMPVSRIAKTTGIYHEDANTLSVSEQIADEMKKPTLRFFLISDSDGKFAGIFSTRDIMMHLAAITRQDIDTAGAIQSRIVPENTFIVNGRVEAAASTQMALGVGGDFYSIRSFPDEKWFFLTADVSGKGMGASLLTSIAGGFIHMYNFSGGIKQLIKKLNSYIFNTFDSEKFITSVFMTLDGNIGDLSICDMGHSMVYLMRNNKMHHIKSGLNNLPLGIVEDIDPASVLLKLKHDDIILLVTDGVTEQRDTDENEYSIDRCGGIIAANIEESLEKIMKLLRDDINIFRGGKQQYDDITYMLIRYR